MGERKNAVMRTPAQGRACVLGAFLALTLLPLELIAQGQRQHPVDVRFRFLANDPGSLGKGASVTASTVRFVEAPSSGLLKELEASGVRFLKENGEYRGTRTVFPAEIDLASISELERFSEIASIQPMWRPFRVPPLDVSRVQIQADSAWTLIDGAGRKITGKGVLIADFDTGVDFFHPMLWFADGDTLFWLDVNGNSTFDPGTDAVDKNRSGAVDAGEVLRYVELTYSANTAGVYDTDLDFLYNDVNENAIRDRGTGSGFTESSPTYGEQWFVTLDANGNKRLEVGERLVGLKTSKIRAIREVNGTVRRRGVDLISASPDTGPYGGHGTSVAGIAVGGIAGVHRLAGIAPDAEMIFGSIDYNASPRFFTGLPAMMLWAETEGADVMLYEDGEWVWEYLDGSSNEEVMINEMAAKGIIQVCPAGNLTGGGMQTTVSVPANDSLTVTFTGGSSTTVWPSLRWFSNIGDILVRLQIDGSAYVTLPRDGSTVTIGSKQVFSDIGTSPHGTAMLLVRIASSGGSTYSFRIVNTTSSALRVDGMLGDNGMSWSGLARWNAPTENNTVTWPATADSAIGVAAYRNKSSTTDINTFSGRGTRIDYRSQVDVASPGSTVYTIGTNVRYTAFGGTSSAGPHVAGAVALVLQASPLLSHGEVRNLLRAGAATDSYTGAVPNTTWGWGKLRIASSIVPVVSSVSDEGQIIDGLILHQNYPNPFNATTTIQYEIPVGGPASLKIYNVLGQELSTLVEGESPAGIHRVSWNASQLPSGIYLCRLESGGRSTTTKLVLMK